MALNATQEALLEGAKALRFKAERLDKLNSDQNCTSQINRWRDQAELLDKLACADIGGIELATVDGDA